MTTFTQHYIMGLTTLTNTYHFFPDPIPVLEQAIGQQQKLMQSQDHEIEVKQLRETLQEYNSEFAHVKNQEVTIQKLKDQIKDMEDRMEEMTVVGVM
jgi:homeobox protein cut-like